MSKEFILIKEFMDDGSTGEAKDGTARHREFIFKEIIL
jgi:hypothetical protein